MAQTIGVRAVFDMTQFDKGLSAYTGGLNKAVSLTAQATNSINALGEVAIGAQRQLGVLAVNGLLKAAQAVAKFGGEVVKAAADASPLGNTLDRIQPSLVEVTKTSFAPLFSQIDTLVQKAAPAFLAVVGAAETYLGGLAQNALTWGEGLVNSFATGMWSALGSVLDFLSGLAQQITYWLSPGSPPRILPDIDQWGTDAINEFLNGFTKGDYSVFNELGSTLTALIRSMPVAKDDKLGVVPQILGTREGIAKAVGELKSAGTISAATLDNLVGLVGSSDAAVRAYVESLVKLQAADDLVAETQAKLNAATKAYDALLKPIDDKLASIDEAQTQFTEDQRKAALALIGKDPNATAAEKRMALLEIERIDAERAHRAAVASGKANVDAAQTALDAAKEGQTAAQDQFDSDKARVTALTETNALLKEQLALIESLNKPEAAEKPKGGAVSPQPFAAMSLPDLTKLIPDDILGKIETLKTTWQEAWDAMGLALKPATDAWNANVTPALTTLQGSFDKSMPAISSAIGQMVAYATSSLGIALPGILKNLGWSIDSLADIWTQSNQLIIDSIEKTFGYIWTTILVTITLISGIIAATLRLIQGTFKTFGLALKGDWKGVWENVKITLAEVMVIIHDTLTTALETILKLAGTDLETFEGTWSGIWTNLGTIVDTTIKNISGWLSGLLSDIQPVIDAILQLLGLQGGSSGTIPQPPPKFAGGANFIVPPGFSGDRFPMLVSSGEHVVVTPASQRHSSPANLGAAGGSGGSSNVIINNTYTLGGVTSSRSSQGIASDFSIMAALAGRR